jgi:hypothetical protein
MILIPSYPIGIGFIYILSCYPILFLGANKGQQSNDLLFSVLLPVRKKDVVLARLITVILMQFTSIIIMSICYPFALMNYESMVETNNALIQAGQTVEHITIPGLGLNSYVLLLGIALVGYSIADLIYFSIYYKKGKSIVMSTLFMIIGFAAFICFFTIGIAYIPGCEGINSLDLWIQFVIFGASLLIYAAIHYAVYKIGAKKLEKVDF